MLIRAKFCKDERVRYISHLELMNTFRRTFRRAGIPVAYSQGFNPHPLFSLGQPLPVGMTSQGEYFDLKVEGNISLEKFLMDVNRKLPAGIRIIEARIIPDDAESLMAIINTAIYDVKMVFKGNMAEASQLVKEFLNQKEIMIVRKRRKKPPRNLDIRSLIDTITVLEPARWRFIIRTGSNGNLRPEEVIAALVDFNNSIRPVPIINIQREGLYVKKGKVLYQPDAEEITGVME